MMGRVPLKDLASWQEEGGDRQGVTKAIMSDLEKRDAPDHRGAELARWRVKRRRYAFQHV
jgi:hypothetical protein